MSIKDQHNTVEFSHMIPCGSDYLFRWHNMPGAINRLIPYWEQVDVIKHPTGLEVDSDVEIKLKQGLVSIPWRLKISEVIPGKSFSDKQIDGPFSHWEHRHEMQHINDSNSLLVEHVNFKLPMFDSLGGRAYTKEKLRRLFEFRFKVIANDIKQHFKYRERATMKVLITGSSGLVGSALYYFLSAGGHQVYRLVRHQPTNDREVQWHPPQNKDDSGCIDIESMEGFDAVIHLGGENIANKRWTTKQKQKIFDSRICSTEFLVDSLAKLKNPPEVLISASAIGYYGDRDDQLLDESSEPGEGFLSETCQVWEEVAAKAGIRVVNARFGIIVDPKSGALAKMLPLFQLGGGGNLGNGKQWMSWIALDDVLGAINHCLMNDNVSGPVNFVAPNPVSNSEFTKVLAKVVGLPAVFPAPAFALRLALGEMADALLLASTRVKPTVLENTGYEFSFTDLEPALKHMLGK